MTELPFPDRRTAGRLLGDRLAYLAPERPVVLALPRGGVPVAVEVAARLDAPVDILVTRKIGYPPQPELGVGAIAEGGEPVYDTGLLDALGVTAADMAAVAERERAEVKRRVCLYRGDRPLPEVAGRWAVLVDDGLATGVTARAGLRALRAAGAVRTVLAVPVAPDGAPAAMDAETDEVVTLVTPRRFRSVGEWYESFGQLSDSDVLALLGQRRLPHPHPWRAMPRWRGACGDGAQRNARPHSARPRCRTFPGGKPRNSGIPGVRGNWRRWPSPSVP